MLCAVSCVDLLTRPTDIVEDSSTLAGLLLEPMFKNGDMAIIAPL